MIFRVFGRVDCRGVSDRLLLDFDSPEKPDWNRILRVCRRHRLGLRAARLNRSTNGGWHVVLVLARRVKPWQALVLQSVMGSDWRRESLNLLRLWDGPEPRKRFRWTWNVLYNEKVYNEKTEEH